MRASLGRLWAWALVIFVAHNAEEVIAIKGGWASRYLPRFSWTSEYWPHFSVVAALLSLGVILIAWSTRENIRCSGSLLRIFLWIMLANVAWHVGISVYTRSVAPGALTAVLLVAPLYTLILRSSALAKPPGGMRGAA